MEGSKELKDLYDYGFRIYNPAIAKFLSVDPLTRSYPWYTPYQFAGNMPIKFIDLDGLEPAEKAVNNGEIAFARKKDSNDVQEYMWESYGGFSEGIINIRPGWRPVKNITILDEVVVEGSHMSGFESGARNIGSSFVKVAKSTNRTLNVFADQKEVTRGERVAGKMVRGIVGLALAAPSGGGTLTMVGGVSILFDVNDIGSGIKDAVEGGDNDIAKDLSTEMGGETGAMVYDGVNIIVGWASVLESLSNLKKVKDTAEAIKDVSAAGKGSTESTKDTMDFIKDHIDGEDNK